MRIHDLIHVKASAHSKCAKQVAVIIVTSVLGFPPSCFVCLFLKSKPVPYIIVKVKSLSRVRLCDPWTVAYQVPLSIGFSRQEYWSGLPFPSPGDLPDPGIEPRSPAL